MVQRHGEGLLAGPQGICDLRRLQGQGHSFLVITYRMGEPGTRYPGSPFLAASFASPDAHDVEDDIEHSLAHGGASPWSVIELTV